MLLASFLKSYSSGNAEKNWFFDKKSLKSEAFLFQSSKKLFRSYKVGSYFKTHIIKIKWKT